MSLMGAAVALVGAIALLNLTLTYGLIRRLRTGAGPGPAGGPGSDHGSGTAPFARDFEAVTAQGRTIGRGDLPDGALVAFFSTGCPPCAALLPRFVAAVPGLGLPRPAVLAVVAPGPEEQEYVNALAEVATVVSGEHAATVAEAFGVVGYPVVCRLAADGTVTPVEHERLGSFAPVAP
ncbi:hypothetical protein ABZY68_32530 [Streptomyces sp. NPDC006482]|uniref:hypothetical protein n=1 Tax=Streptomyces sp. NPDC006482 TaxID=3154306 RepID=UPI0033AD9CB3